MMGGGELAAAYVRQFEFDNTVEHRRVIAPRQKLDQADVERLEALVHVWTAPRMQEEKCGIM
jgi:hypothetical protein